HRVGRPAGDDGLLLVELGLDARRHLEARPGRAAGRHDEQPHHPDQHLSQPAHAASLLRCPCVHFAAQRPAPTSAPSWSPVIASLDRSIRGPALRLIATSPGTSRISATRPSPRTVAPATPSSFWKLVSRLLITTCCCARSSSTSRATRRPSCSARTTS